MHVESLTCIRCGSTYPADDIRYKCDCGGSIDVQYDYDEIADDLSWTVLRGREFSHFRYKEFLPIMEANHRIAMGAGGTPLVHSRVIGPEIGVDLWFKMESLNPTGSFKDRGTSVELGKAMDHSADEIVVASTGNMGSSIAAYTARAGVDARIYVPAATGGPKLKQMKSHGAEIRTVDGDYNMAAKQAWQDWEADGIYLMGDYPYRGEGEKTIGHELADQLDANGIDADTVVVPVGNGTLIHAVWKGFEEFRTVGLLDEVPRITGVQADGCNTVVAALEKGFDRVEAVETVDTVAGAIACGDPLDGDQALAAIQDSDGFGVVVSDEEILDAKERLAVAEGVYAEEAGAAALAGIIKDADRFEGETVVCLVTGHGLKT